MRLEPDQDALDFGASIAELLADAADSAALRAAWDSLDGRVPGLWKRLADVGVLGSTIPEEYGGLGLDARSMLPVLIASGRAALPEPLVETLVGAALIAEAGGALAAHWLPLVADGNAVIAVGLGPGELVSGAQWADLFLLRDKTGALHAVEASEVVVHPEPSLDGGMRLGRVDWAPTGATRLDDADADADADAAFDLAAVLVAAQLVGLADAMLDLAVRYALQREQFGKVIGSFQAVKHQLADVYVANAFAKPVVARGAWSVATDEPTSWRDASHAKYAAGRAAGGSARTALQVHAGIGYTFEHDLHIWMKRTWSLTSLWGDSAWHRGRVADAVLDED
jgi:alkylation response protein AidB-like acyl-CoA dehydrogenase